MTTLHKGQAKRIFGFNHTNNTNQNDFLDRLSQSKTSFIHSKVVILSEQSKSSYHKPLLKQRLSIAPILSFDLRLQSNRGSKNNNELKSQISLYKRLSIENTNNASCSNYFLDLKEKKINSKLMENRMNYLCSRINIQPTIEHLHRSKSESSRLSRVTSPLPTKLKLKLVESYKKIPFVYRNSTYNALKKRPFSHYEKTKEDKRYAKPMINLEAIIQNYNANAKKCFSCEKVKMYQVKISPFLCKTGKM